MLFVDFETRSYANLKVVGSRRYALAPSTEIICCTFALDDQIWTYLHPELFGGQAAPMPSWLGEALDSDCFVAAHNVPFDRAIWHHVGYRMQPDLFCDLPLERWYDTATVCRVNGLPASLDDATRAIGTRQRKDHYGSTLIRKCSIPPYCEEPVELTHMVEYCEQDVRATQELVERCRPLLQTEHADWVVSERINALGVAVDTELATYAVPYAEAEQQAIGERLDEITCGIITRHSQTQRISTWVREQLEMAGCDTLPMVRYKNDKKRYSVDKSVRAELLDRQGELKLPDHIVEVLQLTDDGNRSSVAKFQRMLDRSESDDVVRGSYVYAGASQTLRFAARGLQVHNMRRDAFKQHEADSLVETMSQAEPLPDVMNTLSRLLRSALVPRHEDRVFVVGDWSAIEAMALPWLANSVAANRFLDVFRRGEDPYVHTAKSIGIDDRQIGKVVQLSMGYGGAVGAFNAMARNYGVKLPEAEVVTLVKRWRDANPWAVDFWHGLHQAAIQAMSNPDSLHSAGQVAYTFRPDLLDGTLMCILPGDVVLQYPRARIEQDGRGVAITAIKASWKPKKEDKHWPRVTLWHGLLAENATQALCAAILRYALRQLIGEVDVVLHTHDEIVLECAESERYTARALLSEVMNTPPPFTPGLPLRAEPHICYRYGHK